MEVHIKAMYRSVEYCESSASRGRTLKPNRRWKGKSKTLKLKINLNRTTPTVLH